MSSTNGRISTSCRTAGRGMSRRRFLGSMATTARLFDRARHVLAAPIMWLQREDDARRDRHGRQGIQNMIRFTKIPARSRSPRCATYIARATVICPGIEPGQGFSRRAAVANPRGERLKAVCRTTGRVRITAGRTYVDYRELLEKEDVDASWWPHPITRTR